MLPIQRVHAPTRWPKVVLPFGHHVAGFGELLPGAVVDIVAVAIERCLPLDADFAVGVALANDFDFADDAELRSDPQRSWSAKPRRERCFRIRFCGAIAAFFSHSGREAARRNCQSHADRRETMLVRIEFHVESLTSALCDGTNGKPSLVAVKMGKRQSASLTTASTPRIGFFGPANLVDRSCN